MKNFSEYLNESLYDSIEGDLDSSRDSLNKELIEEIEKTMDSSDLIDLQNWIGKFEEGDSNTVIDSLTDDSNIYDFYLKHQDDIDSLLSDNEWFNNNLSSLNITSLYDTIIEGTKEAIKLSILDIKTKLF